ncbi:MAG: hypothetical protein JNG88_03035 [Phycisphaerales bacterium]|nr:hypothetical protein [Phycisphaerales bacterium]
MLLSIRPARLRFMVCLGALLCVVCGTALGDVIKEGEGDIPGSNGRRVKWRAGYRKTPGDTRSVHFWYELKLVNPQPGDNVKFTVCAMINIQSEKKCQPAFKGNSDATTTPPTLRCVADTSSACGDHDNNGTDDDPADSCPREANKACWYTNHHFGCKAITLTGANPIDNTSFDETVTLKEDFAEANLMAPYLDFLAEHTIHESCRNLGGGDNQFLTPGDEFNPDGTRSWWIVTGGEAPEDPIRDGEKGWATGNWYTMAYMGNIYDCILLGTLTGAPGGATIEFRFPFSAGPGTVAYTMPGTGCEGESLIVSIPFQVTDELMMDDDEHTYMRYAYASALCPDRPNGSVMEFTGEVVAANSTFKPNGDPLYVPGDFMYGIHAQFVADFDPPYLVSHNLTRVNSSTLEFGVRAGDATTMAIGATLRYRVNGVSQPDLPIPFDHPAAIGHDTLYRVRVPQVGANDTLHYRFLLVDDAENVSMSPEFEFPAGAIPAVSPVGLAILSGMLALGAAVVMRNAASRT